MREGYKETEIGVIPVDWEVGKIDNLLEKFQNGYAFSSKGYKENGTPIVSMASISLDGKFQFNYEKAKYWDSQKVNELEAFTLHKNDLIIAMTDVTPDKKLIGRMAIVDIDDTFLLNQRVGLLKLKSNIINNIYLANYSNHTQWRSYSKNISALGAQANLSTKDIKEAKIPLPPLKEQEKIADILSTADEKIEAITTQIEKHETLKKGLLQKLLSEGIGHTEFKDSELGRVPVGWEITTVGKSSKNFDGQRVPLKSEDRQEIQGVYPYYGAQGIIDYVNDYIFDGKYLLVAEDGENVKGQKYDIAFVVNGKFWVNNHAHILQATKDMNLYFISSILNHINIIKYVTGTGQPKLNKAQLNSIKIPLPPLEEQKQIANILSTADEKLEVLRAKKQMYETLKQGLMQKLLTGEVRV
jgi:type I restriction enzyme S subunit